MIRREVEIGVPEGLHARPAAEFVRLCMASSSVVRVSRPGSKQMDGKSMLAVLSLGLKQGERVLLELNGIDEESLLESLSSVVKGSDKD